MYLDLCCKSCKSVQICNIWENMSYVGQYLGKVFLKIDIQLVLKSNKIAHLSLVFNLFYQLNWTIPKYVGSFFIRIKGRKVQFFGRI